jgi:predicted permease
MVRPRIRRLFRLAIRRPDRAVAEMDDEIRFHLDMRVAQLLEHGWTREAALVEAQRLFGDFPEMRRSLHDAARRREEILTMADKLDALRHDVEYALRQIARAPGLAAAVIATFALGIGANATMFGVIDRLLLRPPAHVRAPEELYRIELRKKWEGEDITNTAMSFPSYLDFRDRVAGFSSAAAQTFPSSISLGLGADARKISGVLVSGTYFATLGVPMLAGRALVPGDDVLPNGSPVVVIGEGLWQREFARDPKIVGKTISLANRQFTIVGVVPAGFVGVGSRPIDAWVPISAGEGFRFGGRNWATDRTSQWMSVIARLRPGVAEAVATAQVTDAYRAGQVADGKPDSTSRGQLASVLPSRQRTFSPARRVAVLLGAVSLLVLLMACANIANLLLVRAFARRREVAVRLALGISRGRLVRQLVTESVVLAVAGGLAALAIVRFGSALVQGVLLSDFAWPESPIDGRVLLFTALSTVIVGIVTGLVPAFQGSDPDLARTLREGTRGSGLARSRTRGLLLLIQAAVSVVLLVGTGLFVRSLRNVDTVDLGVDVDRLLIGTIDLRSVGIDSVRANEYFERVRNAASRIPGVASVTIADAAPFGDWSIGSNVASPTHDSLPKHKQSPYLTWVAPNYFSTVGTRLVAGRAFTESDSRSGAPAVIIVNEEVARWIWRGKPALGQCLLIGEKPKNCSEVVGVAQNTHRSSIAQDAEPLQIYQPLQPTDGDARARMLIVRPSSVEPAELVEPVRRVMQTVMPGVPYAGVRPMRTSLDEEMRPWRLGASMFAAFGLIALVLSSLGLYSVVAYTVAQRMHEMGVRVALGAQVGDIRRLVLTQGLRVAAIGVAGGIIIALMTGKFVASLLFETSPRDPMVFSVVAVLLLAVATVASLVPARRAVRADPLTALRSE